MILLALACVDPGTRAIAGIELPQLAADAALPQDQAVIAVTRDALWLDPAGDPPPVRVLGLSDPQDHALALPALVAALEPLRDGSTAPGAPFRPVVALPAQLPFSVAVRVLHSVSMAMGEGVWIAVEDPAGRRGVALSFPTVCGGKGAPVDTDDPVDELRRLVALIEGAQGACVTAEVRALPAGYALRVDELVGDVPGCTVPSFRAPAASDWRGSTIGGCPGATDLPGLERLLAGTGSFGPPCGTALVFPRPETPWATAVALFDTVRKRHAAAAFGIVPEGAEASSCPPPVPEAD